MASSGTYTFSVSRDDIISAALRLTTAFGSGDVIPAEDIADCSQALNIMVKEMATDGLPLWCVQDTPVPLTAGVGVYDLSTITGQTLPLRLTFAYIRDSAGNDTEVTIVSRYDYDRLGQKASPGVPNQLFYDPQVGAGMVTLYNVPADSTHTLHLVSQRQIQDFNLATDTPDFPQEAYRMLKWGLADEIMLDYATPPDVRQEIMLKAPRYKDKYFAFQQEQVPVFFTPSQRTY